jgi:hypothetical protein
MKCDFEVNCKRRQPFMRFLKTDLLLTIVFVVLFAGVFLLISNTQSAYSTPNTILVTIHVDNPQDPGVAVRVGPIPNSTNIPLNTTIEVFQPRYATLENLHLTPEEAIASRIDKHQGLASRTSTF